MKKKKTETKNIDWQSQDWRKRNADLARELGCGTTTVARWRKRLNQPTAVFRLSQHDKNAATEARLRSLKKGGYDEAYLKKSLKMRGVKHGRGGRISETHLSKGTAHHSARHHKIMSPGGIVYDFENIELLIRDSPSLFLAEDIEIRKKPGGGTYTRAANGLSSISSGKARSWKGWTRC